MQFYLRNNETKKLYVKSRSNHATGDLSQVDFETIKQVRTILAAKKLH